MLSALCGQRLQGGERAACAGTDTEKVVRMRAKYDINSVGPMPYPTRNPASPCAFEKVRSTTTFFRPSERSPENANIASRCCSAKYWREIAVGLVENRYHVIRNTSEKSIQLSAVSSVPVGLLGFAMKTIACRD